MLVCICWDLLWDLQLHSLEDSSKESPMCLEVEEDETSEAADLEEEEAEAVVEVMLPIISLEDRTSW